ncbi:MAG: phage integrase SAM-like domain-containing protein, partial [Alloprevotella sp.]
MAKDIEYYTCSQLVQYIEEEEGNSGPKSIHDIGEKFLTTRRNQYKDGTLKLYRDALCYFEMFFGSDYLMQLITSDSLHRFELFLKENRGLSKSTISIKMRHIHTLINYAIRQKFVEFDVSPYADYQDPEPTRRDCTITLEQLRMIRDVDLSEERAPMIGVARDIFMLSFYLCGMNLQDMLAQNY